MTSDHGDGVVIGTVVKPCWTHPGQGGFRECVSRFADPGLGASPTWHGFAIDRAGIAFTEAISVVGDQRLGSICAMHRSNPG